MSRKDYEEQIAREKTETNQKLNKQRSPNMEKDNVQTSDENVKAQDCLDSTKDDSQTCDENIKVQRSSDASKDDLQTFNENTKLQRAPRKPKPIRPGFQMYKPPHSRPEES